MIDLNKLAAEVHAANAKWWQDIHTGKPIERNKGELLMLVVTELAEAMEGVRKGLQDDKLPHRKMEEVEMADALIRILDMAGGFKIHLSDFTYQGDVRWTPPENRGEAMLEIAETLSYKHSALTNCLSNAIWQIRGYCRHFGLDLDGAFREKMTYNAKREDHTHEARRKEGGKKV